jgi:hypothetical protein
LTPDSAGRHDGGVKNKRYVRPAEGINVRYPAGSGPAKSGKHMPPHGGAVPSTAYWLRRLSVKDVLPTTKEEIAKAKAAAKKKKAKKAEG